MIKKLNIHVKELKMVEATAKAASGWVPSLPIMEVSIVEAKTSVSEVRIEGIEKNNKLL